VNKYGKYITHINMSCIFPWTTRDIITLTMNFAKFYQSKHTTLKNISIVS